MPEMTKPGNPMIPMSWEATEQGINLEIGGGPCYDLPMTSVRELRDDMEDADMLSRGSERLEVDVSEVMPRDRVRVCGDTYDVTSVARGKDYYCLTLEPNSYTYGVHELSFPADKQITIYREVE